MRYHLLSAIILIVSFGFSDGYTNDIPKPVLRKEYLEFARHAADWAWEHQDSLIAEWRSRIDPDNIFGYRPPSRLLETATIYATLFEIEGNEEYARRAFKILTEYPGFRKDYPQAAAAKRPDYTNGVPALPDFFTTMRFVKPYDILKRKGFLDGRQVKEIEETIAHSIEFTLQTQEWGAMNRAALRAEALAWAVRALPDHPRAKYWKLYEHALGFDNWGNWEIEDAMLYHPIWLYALLGYADAQQRMNELFKTPEMYYYAQYFLYLICPDGMVPDFGDAAWQANWDRFLVFFEAAAEAYDDPMLKWAAAVIADRFLTLDNYAQTGRAYLLLDAYRYANDDILPRPPEELSLEVMEDVQGKKIVFRDGWEMNSTYMLLNYRDEGDGGRIFRDYLRDGIAVEEEKMTHGHADENSIVLLMNNGSVLLHDGGYRDYMPSGPYGAYRQDYFHNRLCVRPGKIWMGQKAGEYRYSQAGHPEIPGQSVLDFLHNSGAYRIVRTQKVDFLTFPDFDYSRTRLIDDRMGYESDRIIVWVKEPGIFVVFDILKATREGFMTAANLWHSRQIVAAGEHWYDTSYDSLGSLKMKDGTSLLIYFPKTHYRLEMVEKERRYYQDEWVIAQYTGQNFELGQHIGFVTVLIPHADSDDPSAWINKIRFVDSQPAEMGMAVEIEDDGAVILLGVKNDLRMDMVRDFRRPKYTYESGRLAFGSFESNGDFFFTRKQGGKLEFTVVNLSKAKYGDTVLFSQKSSQFGLAFDGSSDEHGIGKARYWRDEVLIK